MTCAWCFGSQAFPPSLRSASSSIPTESWRHCFHFFRYCLQLRFSGDRSTPVHVTYLPTHTGSWCYGSHFFRYYFSRGTQSLLNLQLTNSIDLQNLFRKALSLSLSSFYSCLRTQQLLLELEIRLIWVEGFKTSRQATSIKRVNSGDWC